MKRAILSVLLSGAVTAGSACSGRAGEAISDSRPAELRVTLLQHSYWGGGFDRPLFVALADGRVLVPSKTDDGYPLEYSQLRLLPTQLDSLLESLGVGPALWALNERYDYAPNVTDQHSLFIMLEGQGRSKTIQLRAALVRGDTMRSDVPVAARRFYAAIKRFAPVTAARWDPDSIEVSIWPYEYAPDDPPVAWPKEWPSLEDSRWSRTPDDVVGEMRYLRLPFSAASRVDSIVRVQRTRQAIGIGGKKWALSYRWLFPAERAWRRIGHRLES